MSCQGVHRPRGTRGVEKMTIVLELLMCSYLCELPNERIRYERRAEIDGSCPKIERYERRFTRARWSRKNCALRPGQSLGDIAENGTDGKFGQLGLYRNGHSGHANRPAASGVVFKRLICRF